MINKAEFKNDIGPIGLWHLSPGAPVSQAVSCTVWSKTAMSNCPCECIFSISSALLKKYGENKKAAICVESSFQAPSFVPGFAVDPTNAPVKHRFFKMVRRITLVQICVTLPAKKFKGLRSSGGEIAERASENSWLAIPRSQLFLRLGRPVWSEEPQCCCHGCSIHDAAGQWNFTAVLLWAPICPKKDF